MNASESTEIALFQAVCYLVENCDISVALLSTEDSKSLSSTMYFLN